ncbi:MAG: TetR family transcriptional regulator [Bauldia sp.]|nr:TetR family transcriptional regulator [Bauldia sp.]
MTDDVRAKVKEVAREARAAARALRRDAGAEVRTIVEEARGVRRGVAARPRRRDAEATKAAILAAAQYAFAHAGYDQVGLRDIARRANADVALVARYFGSKEDLFRAAIAGNKPRDEPAELPARNEFGVWIARRVLARDDSDPTRLLVLHHSVGNPRAAAIVREMVTDRFIRPVGAAIGGPEGELRASLIYSLLAGFGLMGRLVALDAIANADREVLIGHVGRAIQAYFDGAPAGVRQPGGPGRDSAR